MFCRDFFELWPRAVVTDLSRLHSDHCPILLKVGVEDFGPKVFKCFNSWFLREDFERTVRLAYALAPRGGSVDRTIQLKLQNIKKAIKGWWVETKAKEEEEWKRLKENLECIERVAERRDLLDREREDRVMLLKRINELVKIKGRDLRQKAKVKWAVDRDENSSFFHGVVNARNLNNRIVGLKIEGQWVSNPKLIKDEVLLQFQERFTEPLTRRPKLWFISRLCHVLKLEGKEMNLLGALSLKSFTKPIDNGVKPYLYQIESASYPIRAEENPTIQECQIEDNPSADKEPNSTVVP
ncbi:hypothetical protein SSX86_003639 [Deinandra increscens subsp. villosa]|uniref:Reverse transcriptase n=1 Tax=Deinandra increscens subsp. villosa TaxID=3103831 RepID=A0AAP0H817_9ASTR